MMRPSASSRPALEDERSLVADHGEGHAVGAVAERAGDDTAQLAALLELRGVAREVGMAVTKGLAELEDGLAQLHLPLAG